jgi:hypothetical protein
MTIREKLEKQLFENGLFEKDASEVVKHFENSKLGEPMKGRMDEDASTYPAPLFNILWVSIKAAAVEWIDANCPQNWARAMFVD